MNRIFVVVGMLFSLCGAAFGQSDLMGNGGFEFPIGSSPPGWTFVPAYGATGAAVVSSVSGYAHSGTQFLLMGNVTNGNQTVSQTITIPTNAAVAVLNYYWAMITRDIYANDDLLKVWIVNTNLAILATVDQETNTSSPQNAYIERAFDLTPYAGQTISVYFAVTTDTIYGNQTAFFIDDVRAQVATIGQLPANDAFSNRLILSGLSVTNYATNTFATKEAVEPAHDGNPGGRSLWWSWTAPSNTVVTIKTLGSTFNTLLGVYTGSSVGNLTQVAADSGVDESSGTAQVKFTATAGTEYEIAVDGYNGDLGSIVLTLNAVTDSKAPTVSIAYPAANAKLTNSTVQVRGTAADNFGVGGVQFRLENASGTNAYQLATGTTAWSATVTNLMPGLNTVRVFAFDTSSNTSAMVARSFTYLVVSPLTLTASGSGTVTPNYNQQALNVGSTYTVTAKPGIGYIFAGWSGGTSSTSLKLTFTMQTNLVLQANFIPNPYIPVSGNYQGLYYDTNDVAPQSSGFISAAVKTTGAFSAKLQSGSASYSLSGLFNTTGAYSNSIARQGLTPLSVQLQLDMAGDTLSGVIRDGTFTAQLLAYRDVYSRTAPAPQNQIGKYTMLIPGAEESEDQPGGDGWGTILVDAYGNVTLTGSLADSTKLSQKTFVSGEGVWPLFAGNGALFGWVTLTNDPASDMDGILTWFKPAQPASKFYPAGFTHQSAVVASRYLFTNNVPVLDFSTGQVWLANGNLSQSFTNWVVLGANDKVTGTNKLGLTITTTSGAFKGLALSPDTGKPIAFSGVILEKQGFGAGFFAGTNQVGRVWFGAPTSVPLLVTDTNGVSRMTLSTSLLPR